MKAPIGVAAAATFSPCGLYRWSLERRVSKEKRILIFVGLNPSKASSYIDDPTLKRLLNFTFSWGYGSLIVVNLFARISSSPSIIRTCSDPVGQRNDQELSNRISQWSEKPHCDLWLGWGNQGVLHDRNVYVMNLLRINAAKRVSEYPFAFGPLVIGLTRKGEPRHPLYVSNREVLRPLIFV